jgi:hypothetical protein
MPFRNRGNKDQAMVAGAVAGVIIGLVAVIPGVFYAAYYISLWEVGFVAFLLLPVGLPLFGAAAGIYIVDRVLHRYPPDREDA